MDSKHGVADSITFVALVTLCTYMYISVVVMCVLYGPVCRSTHQAAPNTTTCAQWVEEGECFQNAGFMLSSCAGHCLCDAQGPDMVSQVKSSQIISSESSHSSRGQDPRQGRPVGIFNEKIL